MTKRPAHLAATLLALAMLPLGCGESAQSEASCNGGGSPSSLEGSYCEGLEMIFTEVQIEILETDERKILTIEYVRPLGDAVEKTLQIIFDTTGVELTPNTALGLVDLDASLGRCADRPEIDGGDILDELLGR